MIDPKYFFYIRQELSDVPEEYVSDEVILRSLQKADRFLDLVLRSDVDADTREECLFSLATYFTYLNYTSVVARGLGSTPEYSDERAERLRNIALMFIRPNSDFVINDDLTIDFEGSSKRVVQFTTTGTFGEVP